jgi:hypothetical protein
VRNLLDLMAVDVPEGEHGRLAVTRFDTRDPQYAIENMRYALDGRAPIPGVYTHLSIGGRTWMSDTTAERRDHIGPAVEVADRGGRVLIGGLGLGMILRVALLAHTVSTSAVTAVDVVECDEDVIALVGPHYQAMAADHGVDLTIHHDDMMKIKWPPGTTWDVAWFDIWPDLCVDNLQDMARLRRSYSRRSGWCDCWGRHILLRERARGRWSW